MKNTKANPINNIKFILKYSACSIPDINTSFNMSPQIISKNKNKKYVPNPEIVPIDIA